MSGYRYSDFVWFPAASVDILKLHLVEKCQAHHLIGVVNDEDKLRELVEAVKDHDCVKALHLPLNQIDTTGSQLLQELLFDNKHLLYMNLEQNSVDDESVKLIVQGLANNSHLKAIFLGQNMIGNEGVKTLTDYVGTSKTIRLFSVGCNFDDNGAFMIAKALNRNSGIEAVYLENNQMTEIGANILAEVASRHTSCSDIKVSSNKVSLQQFQGMLAGMTETELKKAFELAVINDEKGAWMRSKIMVVGQGRAGKTATVRSLLGKSFNPKLESTVGADISTSNTKSGDGGTWAAETPDSKVDFTTDTAARLAALKLARNRANDAEKIENFSIQDSIEYYKNKKEAEALASENTNRAKVFQVFSEEEINKKFDVQLVTNKKAGQEDISFTIWDYGGQKVFYTLHHLFLTRYGIYLLAFDMRDIVSEDFERKSQAKEYLEFWLNSIRMHAAEAPLLLIGTFLDVVRDVKEIKQVDAFIEELLEGKESSQVVMNQKLHFFPLSNKQCDRDVTSLMNKVDGNVGVNIDIIRQQLEISARKEDFVNQKLSLRWVKTLDLMLAEKGDSLKLDQVRGIAERCGVTKASEVDRMLAFFHELGMIVHLTSTQNLKDIVTTKPQWLIDSLSQIIRDSELHPRNAAEVAKVGLTSAHQLLESKSIATRDWLEYAWNKNKVDFLIDLMRRTMLMSDWNFGEFREEPAYLIPSLISKHDREAAAFARIQLMQFGVRQQLVKVKPTTAGIHAIGRRKGKMQKKRGLKNLKGLFTKSSKVTETNIAEENGLFLSPLAESLAEAWDPESGERPPQELVETEEDEDGTFVIRDKHLYAFPSLANAGAGTCIVFDFSESFLPNGVFQRLLCLCILKASSSEDTSVAEPELCKSVAVIDMGNGQEFTLYKHGTQLLCKVTKDHMRAYKMLQSMLFKLKADVMGSGLGWRTFLEVAAPAEFLPPHAEMNKTQQQVKYWHMFLDIEEVKARGLEPWYREPQQKSLQEVQEKEEAKEVGIELEAFLLDLDNF